MSELETGWNLSRIESYLEHNLSDANVRVSLASDSEYLEMYRREHHLFSNSLPKLAETELMWLELERLLE